MIDPSKIIQARREMTASHPKFERRDEDAACGEYSGVGNKTFPFQYGKDGEMKNFTTGIFYLGCKKKVAARRAFNA